MNPIVKMLVATGLFVAACLTAYTTSGAPDLNDIWLQIGVFLILTVVGLIISVHNWIVLAGLIFMVIGMCQFLSGIRLLTNVSAVEATFHIVVVASVIQATFCGIGLSWPRLRSRRERMLELE